MGGRERETIDRDSASERDILHIEGWKERRDYRARESERERYIRHREMERMEREIIDR